MNAARDLDVVVFGATGVTGREVARYLAGTGGRWGAAGRDPAKLERTLADVGAEPTATIAADVSDPDSLAAMAASASVVLNLVGPYTNRGRPVIEACIEAGTHYVDLTGEIPFVREMVEDLDVAATEAEVKVVQVCGFEALPPDLAVQLAAETARERWDAELERIDVTIAITAQPPGMPRASDAISGGTFQSMAEAVGCDDPSSLTDPAALISDPQTAAAVRAQSPIELRAAPRQRRDADRSDVSRRVHQPGGDPPDGRRDGGRARGRPAALPLPRGRGDRRFRPDPAAAAGRRGDAHLHAGRGPRRRPRPA